MDDLLGQVKVILEKECRESSVYPYSAYAHLLFVGEIAKKLAKENGGDAELAEIAGCMHDLGAIMHGRENHQITGEKEAEKILNKLGYPQEKIDKVKHCILAHRSSLSIERITIEAKCVADADAIAHFEQVPDLIEVARATVGMSSAISIGEIRSSIQEKLERDWEKLTPEAQKTAERTYKAALKMLENFGDYES